MTRAERIQRLIDQLRDEGHRVEVIDIKVVDSNAGKYLELRAWVDGVKRDFQF